MISRGTERRDAKLANFQLLTITLDRLAQLEEHRTAVRELSWWSTGLACGKSRVQSLGSTKTQGLEITEENVLPLL